MDELKELKSFCKLLADESGKIVRQYFRKNIEVETKADESPVTIVDKKTEERMREIIMKEYPDFGILGEEFGKVNPDAEYQWILDPIDGTQSFISGAISFGTLIALLKNGKPILGVINQPILNEFLMGDNTITELNGKQVQVRECADLDNALLLTTDHLLIEKHQDIKKFDDLVHKVRLYRQWGDCYGYYLVASGFADIMIDAIMSPWDYMALIPIINGAGGVITDYQGKDPVGGDSIVATTKALHKKVISILND